MKPLAVIVLLLAFAPAVPAPDQVNRERMRADLEFLCSPPVEGRDELVRLRRENRVLRMEKEILGKAAAFFATENGHRPS